MGYVKTFEDQSKMGTFSQINLEDGNKVLISFTQSEAAVFKVGFLGFPGKKLWSMDMDKLISIIVKKASGDDTLLETLVKVLVVCETLEEVIDSMGNL
jgi:hypothetical protein